MTNFLENSLSDSISSWIIWIEKLDYFMAEFISLTMVAIETEKRQFPGYCTNGCYEEKSFFKKFEFYRLKPTLRKLG